MELDLTTRIRNAWNTFLNKNPINEPREYSYGTYYRPDRYVLTRGNNRSIVTSVLNRIALDVAAIDIKHCRTDENGRYKEELKTSFNNCLTLESNIDQNNRAFFQDIVLTMFDEGAVAVVPVDTTADPYKTNSYDILTMRAGKVIEWFPSEVKVRIYNDRTGQKEDITLSKKRVAIIENPLYSVMNQPNSTLQRLFRKLVLLDSVDEQTSSGKLDLIIQLPYIIKSEARKSQANARREEIERQLANSKYGIAYTDGTEKITQLNRSLDNGLMKQIEYLTNLLYSQLGITSEILNGTANETVMINYYSRTIEPIVTAITKEFTRKFISKTARTQGQCVLSFRNPFTLVPAKDIAELADKFTRNEIMSSNEIRSVIGLKPVDDPRADMLINSNLNHQDDQYGQDPMMTDEGISNQEEQSPVQEQPSEDLNDEELNNAVSIYNNMTEEQQNAVDILVGKLLEQKGGE